MPDDLRIVSVNIGTIEPLGDHRGRLVYSAIRKRPADGRSRLWLGREGLDGDHQADERLAQGRRIHGGPLKAVSAYPHTHYPFWEQYLDHRLEPGAFGENLTITGTLEGQVTIGQRWRWDDAILEVTGPRWPCYKLNLLHGNGTAQTMMRTGFCGWYLKVIEVGAVPTAGFITSPWTVSNGQTISAAFRREVAHDPRVSDD